MASPVDAVAKAVAKLTAAAAAAAAMDKARASLGMMTKEAERAAKAQDKLAKAQERADKAAKKAAQKQADNNAASAAEAQAAALGMVEAAAAIAAVAILAFGAAVASAIGYVVSLVGEMNVLSAQFGALQKGGPAAGNATLASLQKLASTLPFAASKVTEWGKTLMMAKLQGKDLENAVKAVAGAAALMGDSGAASATKMFETLARGGFEASALVFKLKSGLPEAQAMFADMGLRVEDVAAALGTTAAGMRNMSLNARQMAEAVQKALAVKAAGPLGAMMLTWPVIVGKLKEGFGSLFEKLGPSVNKLMTAVQKFFGQFGRGTPTMRALSKVVTEVFGTIFKYATMAVKAVTAFVKANVTAGSIGKAWASVKSAIGTVVGVLGKVWTVLKPILTAPQFIKGITTVFKLLAGIIVVVVGVMVAITATIGIVAGAFMYLATSIWGVIGYAIDMVSGVLGALGDLATGGTSAAGDFISGLVGGIASGAGMVIDAVKALASSALGAFKSVLGIASPSKVMAKQGGFAAEGAADGIDAGAGKVEQSATKLGAGVATGAASGMGGGAKGGKGGISVTLAAGAVTIHAAGAVITDEGLAMALERVLAAQGYT